MTREAKYGEALAFLEAAIVSQTDECIIWPFSTVRSSNGDEYGKLKIDGNTKRAHRIVCQRIHGDPPFPDAEACHAPKSICGSTLCINPRHIRWGTRQENRRQRRIDGTHTEAPIRKLSKEQVDAIFFAKGSQQQIAASYGISDKTVSNIKLGRHEYSRKLYKAKKK